MIKFTERVEFVWWWVFFPSLTALVSFFTKSGYTRWKEKKKKKDHVINKELKLGELIKYEYRSKELNVS